MLDHPVDRPVSDPTSVLERDTGTYSFHVRVFHVRVVGIIVPILAVLISVHVADVVRGKEYVGICSSLVPMLWKFA